MQPWVWRGGEAVVLMSVLVAELAVPWATAAAAADGHSLLLQCPPPPANCTYIDEGSRGEYFFDVAGHQVRIDFRDGYYFAFTCEDPVSLVNPGLPRFTEPVRVTKVKFDKCAPPSEGSYAAVLAACNVTAFTELKVHSLPASAVVTRQHLTGLQHLTTLELFGTVRGNVSLAPGALPALSAASEPALDPASEPALRNLVLHSVRTPAADLANLPTSLQTLKQWNVGVDHVSFNSLPNLTTLDVKENYTFAINVSNAEGLKVLTVTSPNNTMPEEALPPTLTELTLFGWNDTRPASKTRCDKLLSLELNGINNHSWPVSLPELWVASCVRLTQLHIYQVPMNGTLPALLLQHLSELQRLTIGDCDLQTLPPRFLDGTPRLTFLNLSHNKLTVLPSGLFFHAESLKTLNLSHNLLTSLVADSLSAVTSLRVLHLNDNAHLGDLCDGDSDILQVPATSSALKPLKSLEYLYLSNTRVTRVCSDWRHDLQNLKELHLEDTNITVLKLVELQFQRAVLNAKVFLKGNEFELQYSRDDFFSTEAINLLGTKARVTVFGKLLCDCSAYWTAMEFQRSPSLRNYLYLPGCNGTELDKVDVDRLTCNASEQCKSLALPANCSCTGRDDRVHKKVVFMECAAAGLRELPRMRAAGHKWRLHLANNNISNVTAAHVAHITDVLELDLRNNSIETLDGETAAKLASVPLLLGGNPINCDCESFQMLNALVGTGSQLRDKVNVTCKYTDGERPLVSAPLEPCSVLTGGVVTALALLTIVAIAAAVALARPATLKHVKMFLVYIGWMPPRLERTDDDRRFDAFVSYAHEDEELVVEKLASRLESGPRPYRLCLHYRDWAPGEWIPAQIAASVRGSRRTVAVVSLAYLESGWARAEFREATAASLRDGTQRLVVVLLEDPADLPLDPELSAYLRNNTYVRWGDPWFWEKLKQALGAPRASGRIKARSPSALSLDIPLEQKCAPPPTLERDTPCSA